MSKIDYMCTFGESKTTPAVLQMNIHNTLGISQSLLVIPAFVQRHSQVHPKFSPALRRVPKLITISPTVVLHQFLKVPVTSKVSWNALLRSDTHLNLMLLSSHSIFSQTLLEAPSD